MAKYRNTSFYIVHQSAVALQQVRVMAT